MSTTPNTVGYANDGFIDEQTESDTTSTGISWLEKKLSPPSPPLPTKADESELNNTLEQELKFYTQDDFEDLSNDEDDHHLFHRVASQIQHFFQNIFCSYQRLFKLALIAIFILLFTAYFIWSHICRYETEDDYRLTWITGLVVLLVVWNLIEKKIKKLLNGATTAVDNLISKWKKVIQIAIVTACVFVVVMVIMIVTYTEIKNLISLSGIFTIILIGYVFSFSPRHVKWRPVLVGLFLQFIFALLIIRTNTGHYVFQYLGDRVSEFLAHTNAGSQFVFGQETYEHHFFVFKIMPVIIFFSTVISIMYYLGAMQALIKVLAKLMYWTMGTTAGESMNAAANIFLGLTEAPLTIRPIIGHMTNSELHAVMTGGFATIAGGVFAAFLSFGVPANHLLAASVMSAPAALAMAKLFYPETKKSKTKLKDLDNMLSSPCSNIVDAAATGATQSISMVANIIATVLSFIAILHFMNATLTWFGHRACMTEPLTFQMICSYVMWPMAFLMGVKVEDCRTVAELIGIKTVLNEFIAYEQLGKLIRNRELFQSMNLNMSQITWSGRDALYNNGTSIITFHGGFLQRRSEIIATYALCGFANFGSMGIMVNGLSDMAPHRTADLASIVVRALVAGTMACFLTACIAGLFTTEF